MRYLVAVDTVHTAAALCDYLGERVDAEDEVLAVSVHGDAETADDVDRDPSATDAERDRQAALNVIGVRLVRPAVETIERRGDPAAEIHTVAADREVDEIVLRARSDGLEPDGGLGSTATGVLGSAQRPVVVVPAAAF